MLLYPKIGYNDKVRYNGKIMLKAIISKIKIKKRYFFIHQEN